VLQILNIYGDVLVIFFYTNIYHIKRCEIFLFIDVNLSALIIMNNSPIGSQLSMTSTYLL